MGLFSSSKTIPATGFYALPKAYQDFYNNTLGQMGSAQSGINAAMFTPTPLTQGEQTALGQLSQGFTPTQDSIKKDMSMLMNPYDQYVIDEINRQSQGANSLVNQAGMKAGQMGSNRNFLGSSDVENQRLGQIGQFKQNQYNNAMNTVVNQLTNQRRADAQGALTGGTYQRELDAQTRQAPIAALGAQQSLLSGMPTQFGNFGAQAQKVKSGGLGSFLKTVAPMALNLVAPGAGTALSAGMSVAGGGSSGYNGGLFGSF